MRRVGMGPLIVLGAALTLLVSACGSPVGFSNSSVSGQAGAQATAAATSLAGTPGPAAVQHTLADMDQLRRQLQILAAGSPTPTDLIAMTQRAANLMFQFSLEVSQMSPQDRDQALSSMADITAQMAQVVQTRANQVGTTVTPGTTTPGAGTPGTMMGTPGTMMGTPGTMMGTPGAMMGPGGTPVPTAATATPSPMTVQQMMAAIQQLRQKEMNLSNDQPTYQDIIGIIDQINQMLVAIRGQVTQLSNTDLQNLTTNLGQALDDLVAVMQTRARIETGSVPTIAPNQTVLPTIPTTPTPATATPAATVPLATTLPSATPVAPAAPAATATSSSGPSTAPSY